MTERAAVRMRRTGMKRTLLPLVLLAAVLAGCGDEDEGSTAEPRVEATKPACTTAEPAVIAADLDGDGTREQVAFTSRFGDCAATVRIGARATEIDVDRQIAASELSLVQVPGRPGDLVAYTFEHPRGGFEARLFTAREGAPAEVTRQGGPLVPFVATDTATAYTTVACTADGLTVTSAVAHQPIGVMAAWDVVRTSYSGPALTEGETVEVADNLQDRQLGDYPGLQRNALFTGC